MVQNTSTFRTVSATHTYPLLRYFSSRFRTALQYIYWGRASPIVNLHPAVSHRNSHKLETLLQVAVLQLWKKALLQMVYIRDIYTILWTEIKKSCRWLSSLLVYLCISTPTTYSHNVSWTFAAYSLHKHYLLLSQANCGNCTGHGGTWPPALVPVPPELVKLRLCTCATIKSCMREAYLKNVQDRILKTYQFTLLEVQYQCLCPLKEIL